MNALIAKGLFGVDTMESVRYWDFVDDQSSEDSMIYDMIKAHKKFAKQQQFLYNEGKISRQDILDSYALMGELAKMAPEHRRQEVLQGSMLTYFSSENPEESVTKLLLDGIGHMPLSEIEEHIRGMAKEGTIPPETEALLLKLATEVMDERSLSQQEIIDAVTGNNDTTLEK